MAQPLHQSWTDLHENSKFPFIDNATLRSTDRAVTIPSQAIRDLVLATSVLNAATRLATIERTISSVILTFQQGNVAIATATISSTDDGWLPIVDTAGEDGSIRIEKVAFSTLFGVAVRSYSLNAAASTVVPWTTFYRPRSGLRGFRLPDGTVLTGEVTIIASDGLSFDADGHLNAIGDPDKNIPEDGLIPRGIRQITVETNVSQIVSPQKSVISGRTISLGGKPVAIQLTNPSSDVVKLEVAG